MQDYQLRLLHKIGEHVRDNGSLFMQTLEATLGQDAQDKNSIYLALALQYTENLVFGVGTFT